MKLTLLHLNSIKLKPQTTPIADPGAALSQSLLGLPSHPGCQTHLITIKSHLKHSCLLCQVTLRSYSTLSNTHHKYYWTLSEPKLLP